MRFGLAELKSRERKHHPPGGPLTRDSVGDRHMSTERGHTIPSSDIYLELVY